jgi:hypothetical protein
VVELAEALKQCQDDKKIAEEALEQSKKDLEKKPMMMICN